MVAKIRTVAFQGIDVAPVEVQVKLASGLPAFTLVGLPDKAVSESRERVRAAIASLGLSLPAKRITVNLSPADVLKEGSHFDVPIALGLLAAMGVIPMESLHPLFALGELALDGTLLPVSGVLPAALAASGAEAGILCPAANGNEATWAGEDIAVLAPSTLLEAINHFTDRQLLARPATSGPETQSNRKVDLAHVRGQHGAKRALEIAAAGGHNLLMSGPPGSGKSMLAAAMAGILPPMTAGEMLETSLIHSVAGLLKDGKLCSTRPFRDPHHSASTAAMVGGGRSPKPGEISLAHRGVLFLDELPEFPRAVLEALRQPLETRQVSVARVNAHVTYPAHFQLIAAMNPCRCGYLGEASKECGKAPRCGQEYQSKLSGPLLDRFDQHIEVPGLAVSEMLATAAGEPSDMVAARVARARAHQEARFRHLHCPATMRTNADADAQTLERIAPLDGAGQQLLNTFMSKRSLSMRGYTRILRTARTIADVENCESIQPAHLSEALSYRLYGG